jgi:AcrR family transcriptional regulator
LTSEARKKRKRGRQRQEILVAARALFLHEGYSRFSMRKLAKAVGCVPGTLYLYFRDKDELLAILVEESFEYLMAELEALPHDADPLNILREMMRTYVDFGLSNANHYHFAFMLRRTQSLEEARPRPHRSLLAPAPNGSRLHRPWTGSAGRPRSGDTGSLDEHPRGDIVDDHDAELPMG